MPATSTSGRGTAAVAGVERHPSMVTHPGELLMIALEEGLHLSVSEAARQLGVSRQQLHRIMARQASVTPEMALRIGRLCGNGPRIWMALQTDYDLAQARAQMGAALELVPEHQN